ncbi:sigma-70 family RNA polymerase sigma factor [Piscinibacter sakaiensis]|uniref:sigma-70 family RNA polymerase sigma factor n=1 Tax=Piscinibacter sakaiensis TaxID=1547922 RepID=UPI003AACE2D1
MAGVESAVQVHIDRGDDLNARDAGGMTSLMIAAARGKSAICRLLLEAGADDGLHDPSGHTALEIAEATGATETAAILRAARAITRTNPDTETACALFESAPDDPPGTSEASVGDPQPERSDTDVQPARIGALEAHRTLIATIDPEGDGEFDLSCWEAEQEPLRPEADATVLNWASAIQVAISSHHPIDSSIGWDDIEAYLPDEALPLARAEDIEGRALLRRLLLRAIREGSVPSLDVQELATNEDRSANPEAEAYLTMVVNDLGAEVDERFEYADTRESFKVFVDPVETQEEELALDEAMVAIDRAASPRHEPLRIYQREFQRVRMLTAEEEMQLGQAMEAAFDAALDALAGWPAGIARTLAAGAEAIAGSRQLASIWAGGAEPDPGSDLAESVETDAQMADATDDAPDEDDEAADEVPTDAGDASFAIALQQLAVLVEGVASPSHDATRRALAALRLNRRFLLELLDIAQGPTACAAFTCAMADFRKARDRMTTANLRLAFFQAKKYLYSGEPLDDLAQEGNIGLIKAVDRYDWRRGFRFSTYATWWIRQQISRHIADKARTIRVPVHIYEKVQRMRRMVAAFEVAMGREPALAELAERMEMSSQRVTALLRIAPEPRRLEELPVDELIAFEARDVYWLPDPEDVVDETQLRRAVDCLISSLGERKEQRILRLRFGIGIDGALTLEEIGTRFNVTRERIRQIEVKAIKKLRHPARSEPFERLVMGIRRRNDAIGVGPEEPDCAKAAPVPPLRQRVGPRPGREPNRPAGSPKVSALDQLLAQAAELGIPVEDGRSGASGCVRVGLIATPDSSHRRLARKLLDFGFDHSPGRGYWK